jgi:hypothetical protein
MYIYKSDIKPFSAFLAKGHHLPTCVRKYYLSSVGQQLLRCCALKVISISHRVFFINIELKFHINITSEILLKFKKSSLTC